MCSPAAGGVYRFRDLEAKPELVVSGTALVGVAFGPNGEMVVASNETAYRLTKHETHEGYGERRA